MNRNELKYGTMLSYIYIVIYMLSQLIYTPILLNSLGKDLYGVYSLCISIASYFTILDFGLGNAVVRYASIYKDKNDSEKNNINGLFFVIYLILGLIALIIGLIVAFNIDKFFSANFTNSDVKIAQIIILILTINVSISLPLSVFSSIVTAYQKFIFLKLLNIFKTFASTIIMILFLILGYKAITISLITLITNLIYLIIITIYAVKKLNVRLNFKIKNRKVIKEIFSFSFFVFILLIIDKVNLNVDMIILGKISNPSELTIYSIASKIFQIYITLCGVISSMLLPRYMALVKEKKTKELNNDFIEKSKWQLIISVFICTSFLLIGNEFINIWLGGTHFESYIITCILMICTVIPLSLNVANVILQAKNEQKFRTIVLSIILILNILVSIPFCNKYGAIGCTIGTAITYILGHVIIMGIYFKKVQKLDMHTYLKNIINIFFVHIPFVIIILIMKSVLKTSLITNIVLLILYLIITCILEYKFILNVKERKMIVSMIKRIKGGTAYV